MARTSNTEASILVLGERQDNMENALHKLTDNVGKLAQAQAEERKSNDELHKAVDRLVSAMDRANVTMEAKLNDSRTSMEAKLAKLAEAQSSLMAPKWGTLFGAGSLGLGVILAVCSLYAWGQNMAMNAQSGRTEALEKAFERLADRSLSLEHRLSREETVTELFLAGVLADPSHAKGNSGSSGQKP